MENICENNLIPKDFFQAAEWEAQQDVWLAWPSDENLWGENLAGVQKTVLHFTNHIIKGGAQLNILVANDKDKNDVQKFFHEKDNILKLHQLSFGDIWLRDTAPIFIKNAKNEIACVCFQFNGWGEKYVLPGDSSVASQVAEISDTRTFHCPIIFEGGSIEVNGEGLGLTTKECLLNPNRKNSNGKKEIEEILKNYLGIKKLIWLDEGLLYDHTDGHIDNIARFTGKNKVLCMEPHGKSDPQYDRLKKIINELTIARNCQGHPLEVQTIPSPGKILDKDGTLMPASYLNFFISNDSISVPIFSSDQDDKVLQIFETIFPKKNILGINCLDLLTGGGGLHCISQPVPK